MPYSGLAVYDDTATMYQDISDLVLMNATLEAPLLSYLGDPPNAAERETHDWREAAVFGKTTTLSSNINNSVTAIPLTATANFFVGAIIDCEEELMIVVTVDSATQVTVAGRGAFGTSAASHNTPAVVYVRGSAALEGADPPAPKANTWASKSNYTQIFAPPEINVSGTRDSITSIGGGNRFEDMVQLRLREALADLEWCVINGGKQASNPAGNATTPRTMQGIKRWLSTNVNDLSGAKLTIDKLEDIFRTAWDNGAQRMDLIVCNSFNKTIIAQAVRARVRVGQDESSYMNRIDSIETDFFKGQILVTRRIPQDEILVVTSENLGVLPLQGRSFQRKDLAITGDARRSMVLGEYTNETRHEETHIWIKNTAIA